MRRFGRSFVVFVFPGEGFVDSAAAAASPCCGESDADGVVGVFGGAALDVGGCNCCWGAVVASESSGLFTIAAYAASPRRFWVVEETICGSTSIVLESGVSIGALVAVNSLGSVIQQGSTHFWAAYHEMDGEFGGFG